MRLSQRCLSPGGSGRDAETLDKVQTRWPDFKGNNIPLPAVVAIQRADGHEVGA